MRKTNKTQYNMALLKQAQKKQQYKKGEAELSYELHNSALASYVVMYQSSAPPRGLLWVPPSLS